MQTTSPEYNQPTHFLPRRVARKLSALVNPNALSQPLASKGFFLSLSSYDYLIKISPTRVTSWVIRQEAKDEQRQEKTDNDIYDYFKRQHRCISKLYEKLMFVSDSTQTALLIIPYKGLGARGEK